MKGNERAWAGEKRQGGLEVILLLLHLHPNTPASALHPNLSYPPTSSPRPPSSLPNQLSPIHLPLHTINCPLGTYPSSCISERRCCTNIHDLGSTSPSTHFPHPPTILPKNIYQKTRKSLIDELHFTLQHPLLLARYFHLYLHLLYCAIERLRLRLRVGRDELVSLSGLVQGRSRRDTVL